jgi:plastocyanin
MRLFSFLVSIVYLTGAGAGPEAAVELRTFQFAPDTARVPAGTTVRWTNRDQIEHTVSGGTPDARLAGWHLVLGTSGASLTRTFDRPGTYTYFCDRHQFMRGTVIVTPTR